MRIEQSPVFRKVIVPWYDSEPVCLALLGFLAFVIFFSSMGISVASEIERYRPFVWVPFLLVTMSCAVIASIVIRLVRRHAYRVSSSE
jgi:hypothetical protein